MPTFPLAWSMGATIRPATLLYNETSVHPVTFRRICPTTISYGHKGTDQQWLEKMCVFILEARMIVSCLVSLSLAADATKKRSSCGNAKNPLRRAGNG